jgi:uroporphyrinogen-III synthase
MDRPCLFVTRPQPQADEWVARLEALGQPAVALPLLAIEPLPADDPALQAAWRALPALRLVMFVSPNAVSSFLAARPPGEPWPAEVLAGATGPGTVAALRAAGVPEVAIAAPRPDAAQFDAETLWAQRLNREAWAGRRVLVVRATEGRDWLSQTLQAQGAQVDALAAYRRAAPRWSPAQCDALRRAAAQPVDHAWLFSSSEAITQLPGLLAAHGLPEALAALRGSPALATHPRIAATARSAGFSDVQGVQPDPVRVAEQLGGGAGASGGLEGLDTMSRPSESAGPA